MITREIKVWIGAAKGIIPPVKVSQYDTEWQFVFTVYKDDIVWDMDGVNSISMNGVKEDGTAFVYTGSKSGIHVVVNCGKQMTSAAGRVECELRFFDNNNKIVSTANFRLLVEPAPLTGYVTSKSEFTELDQLVNTILSATGGIDGLSSRVDALQASIGSPAKAATAAAMTEHSKIYVYTGSETGMETGHWYYYDSGWQDGGVYNSVALETDKTLAIEDAAADGAAVGAALSNSLNIKSTLTASDDLDTITKPGLYYFQYSSASHPAHIPEALNTARNRLLVVKSATEDNFGGAFQIIITGNSSGPHLYYRAYYYSQNTWTDWAEAAKANDVPVIDSTLSTEGAAADAKAAGDQLDTLFSAAVEVLDVENFGWEEGGFNSEGYQNRNQRNRIKITDDIGRRGFYVKAGSTISVSDGYKFGVAQYSRYASATDFDLIAIRPIADGGGTFVVPQDCWVKIAIGTANDANLWSKSGSVVTLTTAGKNALAALSLNLLGLTAMDKISALEKAGGRTDTYPLNGEIAINARAYHAKWDEMVNEGFCTRSYPPQYMSFDTEYHFPLYVYHISNYKKYMATDYSVNNYGDGQPWLPVRPKVLLVSGVHGSEKGTPNFLHDFIASMRRDADSAELLTKYDWTIVPLASPWGYSHSFVSNGGAVYYGQAWRPSSYPNLVENTEENGYNSGSRYVSNNWDSYTRSVDPNRDFDDVAGFEAEETQFIRDNVLTQETFDVVIDMHQRAEDAGKQYSFVCFKGAGLTDAQMQPLYQTVVEAGAATDVAMATKYGLDAGVQYSYPSAYGTLLSFSNYAAGKSKNGHGFIDELFTPARYAMTIETSPVCADYSGSSAWHNPIANEYGNTFVHNFLTKFLGKLEL